MAIYRLKAPAASVNRARNGTVVVPVMRMDPLFAAAGSERSGI
jgi:hypothetical protein